MKQFSILSLLLIVALLVLTACSGKTPVLGVDDGKLSPCPETDNCVSSQATDEMHTIAPFQVKGHPDEAMVRLSNAIESMFGAKIITADDTYIRAEYTSRVMRFVDDVEFYYDRDANLIQVRSASRLGYSDFNVNRERIEELRTIYESMD